MKLNRIVILVLFLINIGLIQSTFISCTVSKSVESCQRDSGVAVTCPKLIQCFEFSSEVTQYMIYIEADDYNECAGTIKFDKSFNLTIDGINGVPNYQCDGENFLDIQFTGNYAYISLNNLQISGTSSNETQPLTGGCLTVSDLSQTNYHSNNLYLSSVSFVNCVNQNGAGGAILSTGFNIFGSNLTFSGCESTYGGGAISDLNLYDELILSDCQFTKNIGYYGAISASNIDISDSVFKNNYGEQGGAISASSSLNIENSSFTGNYAYLGGVIIHQVDSMEIQEIYDSITLQNTLISGNSAGMGIIYTRSLNITLESCLIQNNTANFGSFLYVEQSNSNVDLNLLIDSNTTFTNNSNTIFYFEQDLVPTRFTGGNIYYNSSLQNNLPFSSIYMNVSTHVLVNSMSNCNGSPLAINVNNNNFFQCYNVLGECENGSAVVKNGQVIQCNCFSGWTGSTCNHKYPV